LMELILHTECVSLINDFTVCPVRISSAFLTHFSSVEAQFSAERPYERHDGLHSLIDPSRSADWAECSFTAEMRHYGRPPVGCYEADSDCDAAQEEWPMPGKTTASPQCKLLLRLLSSTASCTWVNTAPGRCCACKAGRSASGTTDGCLLAVAEAEAEAWLDTHPCFVQCVWRGYDLMNNGQRRSRIARRAGVGG